MTLQEGLTSSLAFGLEIASEKLKLEVEDSMQVKTTIKKSGDLKKKKIKKGEKRGAKYWLLPEHAHWSEHIHFCPVRLKSQNRYCSIS